MKNRITLKVKHLVIIGFSIFIFLPLAAIFFIPQLEFVVANYKYTKGETVGKEKLSELLDGRLFAGQKYQLIEDHFLQSGLSDFAVYIGPTMTMSTVTEEALLFSWEEKKPYIEDYLANAPVGDYLLTAAIKLAADAMRTNDEQRAEEVINLAAKRLEKSSFSYYLPELELSYVKLFLQQGKLSEAEEMLNAVTIPDDHSYLQAEKDKYEAMILLQRGQQREGLEKIEQGLREYGAAWDREGNTEPIELSAVYEDLKNLEGQVITASSQSGTVGTVSGNISRLDGMPVAHAAVFLRHESVVNQSITSDEFYQTTDAAGNFEFNGVIPGNYQLFVGFQIDHIDGYTWPVDMEDWIIVKGGNEVTYDVTLAPLMEINKPANEAIITEEEIEFSWEAVEDAAYYMLQFHIEEEGVSYGLALDKKVTAPKVKLPIDQIYNLASVSIMDREETTEDYFNPATLLGFANPEGRYSWNVQAFDADGNLLTRSDGVRLAGDSVGNIPMIYLKHRELTAADELLLDAKLEEALNAYRENAALNPEDLHSLRMISRLIGIEGDSSFESTEKLQLPYLKKLAELTGDPIFFFRVTEFYYNEQNWESYSSWYEKYLTSVAGESDSYTMGLHANALMYNGKYEEARDLHHKALKSGGDHRFIGNLLALELYLGTDISNVIDLANKYPFYGYADESTANWSVILHHVKKDLEENEESLDTLQEGLRFYFENEPTELERWKQETVQSSFLDMLDGLEKIE